MMELVRETWSKTEIGHTLVGKLLRYLIRRRWLGESELCRAKNPCIQPNTRFLHQELRLFATLEKYSNDNINNSSKHKRRMVATSLAFLCWLVAVGQQQSHVTLLNRLLGWRSIKGFINDSHTRQFSVAIQPRFENGQLWRVSAKYGAPGCTSSARTGWS